MAEDGETPQTHSERLTRVPTSGDLTSFPKSAWKWHDYMFFGKGVGRCGRGGDNLACRHCTKQERWTLSGSFPSSKRKCPAPRCPTAVPAASSWLCSDTPVRQPHKRLFSAPTCSWSELGQICPAAWNAFFLGLVLTRSRRQRLIKSPLPTPCFIQPPGYWASAKGS